jgi:SPP1 family predicted phage head-tail adaptor
VIKPGDLDRRITFEQRSTSQDATYGTQTLSWTTVATVWAQVRDVLPSRAEDIADNVSIARRPARIRIRYRTGLDSTMRIDIGGRKLRITAGPAEIGRREGIEFMAEEYSTEGDAP